MTVQRGIKDFTRRDVQIFSQGYLGREVTDSEVDQIIYQ